MWVPSLGWEHLLEQEMSTHSSIFIWEIPWMEEPDRLWFVGLQSQTRLKQLSSHAQYVKITHFKNNM